MRAATGVRGLALAALVGGGALTACSALIGTRDLELAGDDGGSVLPGQGDGNAPSGNEAGSSSPGDTGTTPPSDTGTTPPNDTGTTTGDSSACGGADLQQDAKNCGRCAHDCGGGTCSAGVCQAWTLVPGQPGSAAITADDTSIYWSSVSSGQILKANKDGTQPAVLSTVESSIPDNMVMDSTTLYWGDDRGDVAIRKCAKTGCDGGAAELTPESAYYAAVIAVDANNVYFGETEGAIGKVAKSGGAMTFIATNFGHARGLAADDASVFVSTDDGISSVPSSRAGVADDTTDAGPLTPLNQAAPIGLGLLLAADQNLYWAEYNTGAIKFMPKTGAAVASVVSAGETFPLAVAVDDTNVYWTASGPDSSTDKNYRLFVAGYVAMCPKSGCPASGPVKLATGLHNPDGIVVDDTAVYFTIYGNITAQSAEPTEGSIMKVMK
ncbi:MAG TPA: hypothetical protein VGI39_07915 [Polyangiaceae bacterium]